MVYRVEECKNRWLWWSGETCRILLWSSLTCCSCRWWSSSWSWRCWRSLPSLWRDQNWGPHVLTRSKELWATCTSKNLMDFCASACYNIYSDSYLVQLSSSINFLGELKSLNKVFDSCHGWQDAIINVCQLFPPMPRCYYYSMQIFSELDFFAKNANMIYFLLFFVTGYPNFQPVPRTFLSLVWKG